MAFSACPVCKQLVQTGPSEDGTVGAVKVEPCSPKCAEELAPTCRNCSAFEPDKKRSCGECRADPPRFDPVHHDSWGVWPSVDPGSWCRKFERKKS